MKKDIEELKKRFKKEQLNYEDILEAYKEAQIKKIRKSSICCFSLDYRNILMWSHYGDNHKGVVLIFDQNLGECFEDLEKDRISQFVVDYCSSSLSVNYLEDKGEAIKKLFATKAKEWEYEEEFRLVTLKNQNFFKFNKRYLTGVIFGCKVNAEDRNQFKEYCLSHGYDNLKFGFFEKKKLRLELK